MPRERERESLLIIAFSRGHNHRNNTKRKNTCSKSQGALRNLSVIESRYSLISTDLDITEKHEMAAL